jgi:hypothetical protein
VPVPAGCNRIALLFLGGVASLSFPETGRQSQVVPVGQEINDLSRDIMVEQELHGMTLSLSVLLMNAKEHSKEETEDRSCREVLRGQTFAPKPKGLYDLARRFKFCPRGTA